MRIAALVVIAACKSGAPTAVATPAGPSPTEVPPQPLGVGTVVVDLKAHVATPVLDGPFLVTTINPGASMEMAIAPDHHCDAPALVWFLYSGGGVAVGRGQTLCVRTDSPRANGFSGYDPTATRT